MNERDIAIRTIIGEAANEGADGWAAVAHVLRNRAGDPRWPDSVGAVALQPKQFSAWNEGAGGNDLVRRYGEGDAIYDRVGQVVDAVFSGNIADNTGGATHYFSPRGMDALVSEGSQSNRLPNWLQEENGRRGGNTVTIGGHIFTGLTAGSDGIPRGSSVAASMPGASMQGGPVAQAGFTQEQIAEAFQAAEPKQAVQLAQAAPAAPEIAPQQAAPAYQAKGDALTNAMQAVKTLQAKRKGLFQWQ